MLDLSPYIEYTYITWHMLFSFTFLFWLCYGTGEYIGVMELIYQNSLGMCQWNIHECTKLHQILKWRHNERDGVSNPQPHDCLLSRIFGQRSKKTSKLRVTGLCEGNSPMTGEFPTQRTSDAENAYIWWRHHETANKARTVYIIYLEYLIIGETKGPVLKCKYDFHGLCKRDTTQDRKQWNYVRTALPMPSFY